MSNKVFDNDSIVLWKAMVFDDKYAFDLNHDMISFIYGRSDICFVNVIKRNECIEVCVDALDCRDLQFRFHNKEEYNSCEKIFRAEYPDVKAAYTNNAQTFYVGAYNIGVYHPDVLCIAAKVCQCDITDDDSNWKRFCESEHDDYMLLLSKYLNEDARFIESLNKRLEAASDSDKLLAMIGDK